MHGRWPLAVVMGVALAITGVVAPAQTTEPVMLGAAYVLDSADVLDQSDEAAANDRLAQLYADTGVDLYVVLVDEFTNPANSQEWADTVASTNGLGPSQYVLAVATQSRQFYTSADSTGPLSEQELTEIEAEVKPFLSSNDYLGAVFAAADGIDAAMTGSGAGSGGGIFTWLLVVVILAGVIWLIVWLVRRSRRARDAVTGAAAAPVDPVELARRAASALVDTDDAIKTSEQELGFARAQFGDDATVAFAQTLAAATQSLNEAFSLKQQLDDSHSDTPAQVLDWNTRILALCEQANAALDEKAADFDDLRRLEKNAPAALEQVSAQRDTAAAAIEEAEAVLARLAATYHPDAVATVIDNPAQARERIAFADENLGAARSAIAAGDGAQAAVSIRAAEDAVGQALQLEAAIDNLAKDLPEAASRVRTLIAELEHDVAQARALPDAQGTLAGIVAATQQQIDSARELIGDPEQQPLAALHALESANTQIDAALTHVRDAQAQAQRAQQMLEQVMMQAGAQISAADDFITSRRGAVGADARTRLAQARASLQTAQQLQITDPAQALPHAQRADQLAAQAIQTAHSDVGAFSGGGYGGSGAAGSGNGGMLGAVLGGIVINSMLGGGGGGGRSGGFGGSRGSGGGRGFGGGARMGPGSFGGGGTRGRRGGGRF